MTLYHIAEILIAADVEHLLVNEANVSGWRCSMILYHIAEMPIAADVEHLLVNEANVPVW
jgi:hypothetical protein